MPTAQKAPGSENRDLGPGGRGECWRGEGGQHASLGPDQPREAGSPPTVVEVGRGPNARGHTRACPGSACPALVPSFTHCFCLRLTRNAEQGLDAEALREVAASFRYPLGQSPAAWMGPIIALEGRGEAGAAALVRNPGRAAPLHRALWLGPGSWEAALKVSFLSPHGGLLRAGTGSPPIPRHPAGPGVPPQGARGPKGRVGSHFCSSCLPVGVQTQSQDKKILW